MMKIKNLDLNDAIFLSYTQDRKLLWHDELLVDNNGQIIYDKEFSAILSNKNWNYVIDELVRTIEYIVSKTVKDVKKVYLYSGSFGSILGLLLSARFSHNLGGHICVSPLIDLSNQIKKKQVEWKGNGLLISSRQLKLQKCFLIRCGRKIFLIKHSSCKVLEIKF
ncbi:MULTISPECIES: hypothetical protein [Streptococcus]|nr:MULTISPECIES: hypothetical protein [Streptococcus]MBF9678679.1 hypothetical protein [Streptococcus pseudopneumoniae]NIB76768.1 hypothetical protein [Streptococcus pseudopneumoniae]TMR76896.1 hypothetical protein E3V35_12425 [Streptococcus pseudopneumoniae]